MVEGKVLKLGKKNLIAEKASWRNDIAPQNKLECLPVASIFGLVEYL
jgi:hypothetical protein